MQSKASLNGVTQKILVCTEDTFTTVLPISNDKMTAACVQPAVAGGRAKLLDVIHACRVINVWNSLPLNSDDFRSLHCFRSSLNNIDFSRFLIIE